MPSISSPPDLPLSSSHCFRYRMAFGLDLVPTDRLILTERCDGSCIKLDWIRTRRPRFAKYPVLILIYAFVDDSGNDTAGLLSYNLVAQVGNCKSEFATLRSLWSASDLIITLLHQNHTRTIEATTSNSASTHLRLNDTV